MTHKEMSRGNLDFRFVGPWERLLLPGVYAKLMFTQFAKAVKDKNAPASAKVVSFVLASLIGALVISTLSLPFLFLDVILYAIGGEWGMLAIFLVAFALIGAVVYWARRKEVGLVFGPEEYYLAVRSEREGVWLVNSFVAFISGEGMIGKLGAIMEETLLPALEEEGITLEIVAGNSTLAAMYEKCGFRRIDEKVKRGYLRKVRMTTARKG